MKRKKKIFLQSRRRKVANATFQKTKNINLILFPLDERKKNTKRYVHALATPDDDDDDDDFLFFPQESER
jgi:hypothetical protein